jgi:hypothetical protein
MTTLNDIEARAKAYAEQRARLAELVTALDDGLKALKKDHLPGIKRALARAAEKHAELQALIEDAPGLFVKPRTVILHGVKIGYAKAKGVIEVADRARTVALIKRLFPDQAETLLIVDEKPNKTALAQLQVADLKRLGCTVSDSGDVIVIKAVDSEVDRMVDALLADAVDTAVEAQS